MKDKKVEIIKNLLIATFFTFATLKNILKREKVFINPPMVKMTNILGHL